MNKKIQGVILDMDGVIVDSYPYHLESWKQFLKNNGANLSEEEIKATFGRRNEDVLKSVLERKLTEEEILRMSDEKERLYRELHARDIEAVPGLVEMLGDLKKAGIKIAIGSSAPAENIEFVMESLDLGPFINAYVHARMIEEGKPNPEVFLKAADMIRVSPENCVVFEDSLPGIEAGLRAGMKVIAVATTHREEEIEGANTGASGIVKDFQRLSAEGIEELLFG